MKKSDIVVLIAAIVIAWLVVGVGGMDFVP